MYRCIRVTCRPHCHRLTQVHPPQPGRARDAPVSSAVTNCRGGHQAPPPPLPVTQTDRHDRIAPLHSVAACQPHLKLSRLPPCAPGTTDQRVRNQKITVSLGRARRVGDPLHMCAACVLYKPYKCVCRTEMYPSISPSSHPCYNTTLHVQFFCENNKPANICITFIQCWANVQDVGPTLYKYYTNVLCLLGRITHCHPPSKHGHSTNVVSMLGQRRRR